MNITYRTVNVTLTPDIEAYTEEKLSLLEKFLNADATCEAVLTHDERHATGIVYRVDFTIFSGKDRTHAVGHGETLFAALDIAKDELADRIRRDKKMHVRLMRKGGAMLKHMMRFGRSE